MKKIALLTILFSTILVSCTSDDKNTEEKPPLSGNWEFVKEGSIVNNVETLIDYNHSAGCAKDVLEYKVNGSGIETYYENSPTVSCDERYYEFDYVLNGTTITITDASESFTRQIISLTATELKYKEGIYVYVLKRI